MSKKKKKNKNNRQAEVLSPVPTEENLSGDEWIREAQSNFAPIPHSDSFCEKDFSDSVRQLDPGSITLDNHNDSSPKKKRKMSKSENILQLTLFGICAAVLIVCLVMLYQNINGKIRGREIYKNTEFEKFTLDSEDSPHSFNHPTALLSTGSDGNMLTLSERIAAGKTPEKQPSENGEYSQKLDAMKASLTALKAKNSDIYGWIYIENTGVDYPILRGKDNKYYLDHAYTGEALPIGSIFADYHTKDLITDNQNTVIYGHNVVTGAMFHDVTKFLDADFFNKNKIYIYTMDGVFIYKPVSVYPTTDSYFYYKFSFGSDSEYLSFAADVISKSSVPTKEKITSGDTMITLSTCTNGGESSRYALHAKLTETIK